MITQPDAIANPLPRNDAATIETTRLSLCALRGSDLAGLMQVFGGMATARMTHAIPHPLGRDEAVRLLEKMRGQPQSYWAIRTGDDDLAGVVSLTQSACGKGPDLHSFGPNLSVFVASGHQGHGYAVEAIDGLLAYVKRKRLHRIVHAAHFADNAAAARVLVTADFLYTGRRTMETSLAREGEHEAWHMIRIL
ncbi:MAG: GNAT family N-acetyltransferase [Asticcacaulis sp.]